MWQLRKNLSLTIDMGDVMMTLVSKDLDCTACLGALANANFVLWCRRAEYLSLTIEPVFTKGSTILRVDHLFAYGGIHLPLKMIAEVAGTKHNVKRGKVQGVVEADGLVQIMVRNSVLPDILLDDYLRQIAGQFLCSCEACCSAMCDQQLVAMWSFKSENFHVYLLGSFA